MASDEELEITYLDPSGTRTVHETFAAEEQLPQGVTLSPKIPPEFSGRTSWFHYEELVDEWCDITTLDPEKRGPSLRSRLTNEAAVYKPLLDKELLRDPDNGVQYFKYTMRPHFVKGSQSVFLFRSLQLFSLRRGNQEMIKWMARYLVTRKRVLDAWMDLLPKESYDQNQPYLAGVAQMSVVRNQAGQPLIDPAGPAVYAELNARSRQRHERAFPLQDPIFTYFSLSQPI